MSESLNKRIQTGEFCFADGPLLADRRGRYFYSDDWFCADGRSLNVHLRTASMAFCMACFPSVEAKDYDRVYRYAEKFLDETGFSDFQVNEDFDREPTRDSLGILSAHKVLQENGEEVSLVVLGFRGAGYGDEWAINLILGEEGDAEGFCRGMDYARAYLNDYLGKIRDRLCPRVKYWISGFSRVGGIVNLLGEYLAEHAPKYRSSQQDLYIYTFESPAVACSVKKNAKDFIHNTISLHDLVPKMPPKSWGFFRYGSDDTCFPGIRTQDYEKRVLLVRQYLKELNPEIPYDMSAYMPHCRIGTNIVKLPGYGREGNGNDLEPWWYQSSMDEFLERFMDFMSAKIVLPGEPDGIQQRRSTFVSVFQSSFSSLARVYHGADGRVRDQFRAAIIEAFTVRMNRFHKAYLFVHLYRNRPFSWRRAQKMIVRLLIESLLNNKKLQLKRGELKKYFDTIDPLVYYFVRCAAYDMRYHRFAYFSTLASNLMLIPVAHAPEVIFSWLMSDDVYYKTV